MKGLGMGVHIPVEAEVCTDQARQVPAIFALLRRAAGAFPPLSDCNTPLPAASASPEETQTPRSDRRTGTSTPRRLHSSVTELQTPPLSASLAKSRASLRTDTKHTTQQPAGNAVGWLVPRFITARANEGSGP